MPKKPVPIEYVHFSTCLLTKSEPLTLAGSLLVLRVMSRGSSSAVPRDKSGWQSKAQSCATRSDHTHVSIQRAVTQEYILGYYHANEQDVQTNLDHEQVWKVITKKSADRCSNSSTIVTSTDIDPLQEDQRSRSSDALGSIHGWHHLRNQS